MNSNLEAAIAQMAIAFERQAAAMEAIAAAMNRQAPPPKARGLLPVGEAATGVDRLCIGKEGGLSCLFRLDGRNPIPVECGGIEMVIREIRTWSPNGGESFHTEIIGETDQGIISLDAGSTTGASASIIRSLSIATDDQLLSPLVMQFERGESQGGILGKVSTATGEELIDTSKGKWGAEWKRRTEAAARRIAALNNREPRIAWVEDPPKSPQSSSRTGDVVNPPPGTDLFSLTVGQLMAEAKGITTSEAAERFKARVEQWTAQLEAAGQSVPSRPVVVDLVRTALNSADWAEALAELKQMVAAKRIPPASVKTYIQQTFQVDSSVQLTVHQLRQLIRAVEAGHVS